MPEPILEVSALTKHFGGLRAVHLNLTVEAGELRCLIGPNGAGKSTFFRMLSGGMRPSSGTVRFRDRDITGWTAFRIARLGISIKFQVPSILEELSVFQNMHLAAEFRFGNREGRRRAAEMLEVVGLHERADHPATWLSHGEKQWLEIGMASVGEPALVLLDEPTAGMTVEEVKKTVRLLRRLNETATVIVVEHDMNFIRMIARRVTVMHQGEVFAEGSMEEIEANEGVRDIYLGKGTHYAVRR
jgi:branched-chain amino acid transport system ATP-binding protein/urea transport system ATP-binding protein